MADFEATVVDVASDGRGVVKHPDGRTVFVGGVWPGEKGRFRITDNKGNVAIAQLCELLLASPHRVEAPCPHHGVSESSCGACPWQFVSYTAQLDAKQQRVQQAFARIGVKQVNDILPSSKHFHYRNRAQFKTDGQQLGFVGAKSNSLAAISQCMVLSDPNAATLQNLLQQLPNPTWKPTRKQLWTTLDIDDSLAIGEVSVNQRLPFRQANDEQNTAMKSWLAKKLEPLDKSARVLELFCGSGNLTQVIAEQGFEEILAVEAVEEALLQLDALNLPKVTSFKQNLFLDTAFEAIYRELNKPDILVLDPPRDGLKNKAKMFRKKNKFSHIFYIACDLMTLVRDVKQFQEEGYKVREVQALDQFPQTPHIELMVHMSAKNA
ncbi:23S rRNA (uracil(1939)-C(5))-methyltransferase RlmD [Thalassocella blandensis]|nr:23S rRNA (uracil(1939)-C(5))-methyltransferase RlmD [Thalassocella blandensis]